MTDKNPAKKRQRPKPANGHWPEDVCERLGISKSHFDRMEQDGQIKVIRLGRRIRFVPEAEMLRLEGRLPDDATSEEAAPATS